MGTETNQRIDMRLDKFLKVSRILKRRSVANEACDSDRVTVNGKTAKPSYTLKENDVVQIRFGDKYFRFRVLKLKETVKKEEAETLFEVLEPEAPGREA